MTKDKDGKDKGTKFLVIGMIVFVLIAGVASALVTKNKAANLFAPKSTVKSAGYGIVFNAGKKPIIDMWEDFQCSVCGKFESINNAYINSVVNSGKAEVIFHTMSFIGPESVLEANAGVCAADQDKFVQMHSILYSNQGAENSGKWNIPTLLKAGSLIGLTNKTFVDCVTNEKYLNWTKSIMTDAGKHKVTSTPTVLVNGKELDRNTQYMDPNAFKAVLAKAGVN